MNQPDFDFEFIPHEETQLREEAAERFRELRHGHTDLTGASIAIEDLGHATTPHRYRARVVAYLRPDNMAATEKGETAEAALKSALDAIERQVREHRDRLSRSRRAH
jgi:ribosome-associated translation inhibitor RaiA